MTATHPFDLDRARVIAKKIMVGPAERAMTRREFLDDVTPIIAEALAAERERFGEIAGKRKVACDNAAAIRAEEGADYWIARRQEAMVIERAILHGHGDYKNEAAPVHDQQQVKP